MEDRLGVPPFMETPMSLHGGIYPQEWIWFDIHMFDAYNLQKKDAALKDLPIWRWDSPWTTLTLTPTPPARWTFARGRLQDSLWSPGLVVFTEPQRRLQGGV